MGKRSKQKPKKKGHQQQSGKKPNSNGGDDKDELQMMMRDEDRFDISKPQFRQPSKTANTESKVVLDERFASVLSDPRFQLDAKDKYGRKRQKQKKKQQQAKEELSAFYTVQEELDKGQDEEEEEERHGEKDKRAKEDDASTSSSSSDEDDDEEQGADEDPSSRIAYLTALSRGELDVSSSSSSSSEGEESDESSDDDDDDDDKSEDMHGKAGVLDPSSKEQEQVEMTHEESNYLAVMNMDWTNVRAVDIFAIVSSFAPPGTVKRVQVYPSDFGLERIAKEDRFGPSGLWKKTKVNKDLDGDDDDDGSRRGSDEDEDSVSGDYNDSDDDGSIPKQQEEFVQSDFDPEKLRAYEASKLKYFFAIVEFTHSQHADQAYKEIDGMEFEHSSAAVDMRSIPPQELPSVVENRPLRDQATSLPSNYVPPEFIVSALQQTTVQCSWEAGDRERELALTKYSSSGLAWGAMAESDDLKAYLASDVSSDDDDEDENANGNNKKGSNLRKMLGLDNSDDDDDDDENDGGGDVKRFAESSDEDEDSREDDDSEVEKDDEANQSKEFTFVPGKSSLKEKIRSKLENKGSKKEEELTPWEKYQEKRKQKRRERRQEARAKKKEFNQLRTNAAKPKSQEQPKRERDSFFMGDGDDDDDEVEHSGIGDPKSAAKRSQAELELLLAGETDEKDDRDFDMRGLQRLEKNKGKKLRGSRKRKEANLAADVTGTDFQVNVRDERFKAVLDGQDDRFGIDRTDPHFKETPAMREILSEQTRRRKSKRRKRSNSDKAPASVQQKDVSADVAEKATKPTGGAAALSALVKSLKSKVQR